MKKTLVAALASAALLASSAFADITFGTDLNIMSVPAASDGEDYFSGSVMSWDTGDETIRDLALYFSAVAGDGFAGFEGSLYFYAFSQNYFEFDYNYIWVKPLEVLKVSVGDFDNNTLRGDLCYGSWNWLRASNWIQDDEGLTFSGEGRAGVMLEITPFYDESLYIQLFLNYSSYGISEGGDDNIKNTTDADGETNGNLDETYLSSTLAVGYTIEDIGTIKVGYFGDYDNWVTNEYNSDDSYDEYKHYGNIEVAFDLTMVENLFLSVGFQYTLADAEYWVGETSDSSTALDIRQLHNMKIALGASYQLGEMLGLYNPLTIYASGAFFMYDIKDVDVDPTFQFGVGVDFGVTEKITLVADVRYVGETSIENYDPEYTDDALSFMIGATYACGSNGLVGVAFQGATNGNGFVEHAELCNEDKFAWAIPIRVHVWF